MREKDGRCKFYLTPPITIPPSATHRPNQTKVHTKATRRFIFFALRVKIAPLHFIQSQHIYFCSTLSAIISNMSQVDRALVSENSLLPIKRPQRLLIFRKPPDRIWTPLPFQKLQILKIVLSIKGILTNLSVPDLYWRRINSPRYSYKSIILYFINRYGFPNLPHALTCVYYFLKNFPYYEDTDTFIRHGRLFLLWRLFPRLFLGLTRTPPLINFRKFQF